MRDQVQFSQKLRFNRRWYAVAKHDGIWLYQRLDSACDAPSIDLTCWWGSLITADAAYDAVMRGADRTMNMPRARETLSMWRVS